MAHTATMTSLTAASSKRKRCQISYAVDDYFDDLDLDDAVEAGDQSGGGESDSEGDDDGNFGSRRKSNGRPKKKAKTSINSKKGKKEKPFRFLDLPAELRDEIYDLALIEPGGLSLVSRTKQYRRTVKRGTFVTESNSCHYGRKRRRYYLPQQSQSSTIGQETRQLVPNLLAINKQVRAEASAILYGQELILEDTSALHIFITQIGPYNRELLSNVTIKGWGEGRGVHKGHNFAALSTLSTCTNLKSLFVDCSVGWYRSPRDLARQVFRDGHYFLEAVGAAKGKFDAALEVLKLSDWHFDKNRSNYRNYWQQQSNQEPEFDEKKRDEFSDELRKLLSR